MDGEHVGVLCTCMVDMCACVCEYKQMITRVCMCGSIWVGVCVCVCVCVCVFVSRHTRHFLQMSKCADGDE